MMNKIIKQRKDHLSVNRNLLDEAKELAPQCKKFEPEKEKKLYQCV